VSVRAVAISLKIPDNAAYTTLVALRRLDVAVEGVDRSDIYMFDDGGDVASLVERVKSDERIFNPNKHRLTVLETDGPRNGETWIARTQDGVAQRDRFVAWRLLDTHGDPVEQSVLAAAADRLLCNPAIERALF
jgi:phosphoribosylformylglycinamidine (FGAM) synthase PurS component